MNGIKELVAVHCDVELGKSDDVRLKGRTVTLNLDDAGPLTELLTSCKEKRNTLNKPRFMLYLVGLNESQVHLEGERVARIQRGLEVTPLSKRISFLSRDPAFWSYLDSVDFLAGYHHIDENAAKQYINWICRIESRRQLDQSEEAARRYLGLVEKPFTKWLQGQQAAQMEAASVV